MEVVDSGGSRRLAKRTDEGVGPHAAVPERLLEQGVVVRGHDLGLASESLLEPRDLAGERLRLERGRRTAAIERATQPFLEVVC